MARLKYTFKTDILFKKLFVKHPRLLQHLLAHLLGIDYDSISRVTVTNPEMPPEAPGKKFCRLDINAMVDARQVNLEIQVETRETFPSELCIIGLDFSQVRCRRLESIALCQRRSSLASSILTDFAAMSTT